MSKEMLKAEEHESGKTILGMIFHQGGVVQEIADLGELLGPSMLHVQVGNPPDDAENFYSCCEFHIDEVEAKVHIMQKGKHSMLKLRFLPDEETEKGIRAVDFGALATQKVDAAIAKLHHGHEHAQDMIAAKQERQIARKAECQVKFQKWQEDCESKLVKTACYSQHSSRFPCVKQIYIYKYVSWNAQNLHQHINPEPVRTCLCLQS